ncbi:MAG: hypothetical protein MUC87_19955 [Bacteroidia bacterium]|jgi:hypothetical protein|nr:hypothetical protein [Bacteroidia bacterium]
MSNTVFILLAVVLPLIGVLQLVLAFIFHRVRVLNEQPTQGWKIYWLMVIPLLFWFFISVLMRESVDHIVLLCFIPAVYFFFAGKVSDNWKNNETN